MTTQTQDNRRFRGSGDLVADLMAELDKAKISQRLQKARQAAGITQQEMAELMHLHKRSIEDYESVKNATVPFDRMDEWARVTGTTKEALLLGERPADAVRQPPPASTEQLDQMRAEFSAVQRELSELAALVRRLVDPE